MFDNLFLKLLLVLSFFVSVQAKFYLVSPNDEKREFWKNVSSEFQKTSKKLDVNYEVVTSKTNRFSYGQKLR